MPANDDAIPQRFYHGTRANLKPGDLIAVGYKSNYGTGKPLSWVYLTGTLDAAIWGAELAAGDGRERIYIVEPTGSIVNDPNLTDKKFPGNPTQSYRSREPLRVIGEVTEWQGHSPERLQEMKDNVQRARAQGAQIID
ncbi:NAD(+)--rifampin ADP-ribosyltransferase [Rhizobium sp. NPDC090279]|uniref:NAD(+)--rifampin ADP-ribosyltransferase n=1 Tax=Rhizobium sp. NPDC090279 TaxID=3364499 RepID=UPI00383A8638